MRFADAFRSPFESPRWVFNLLVTSAANIVPLIGPIFVMGYSARVIESARAGGPGYHDLDFEQLGDYLLRGLKVFGASVLLSLAVLPFYFLFMLCFFVVVPFLESANGGEAGSGAASAAIGCVLGGGMLLFVLVMVVVMLFLSVPLVLRASLHPRFGAIFSPSFVLDFVRRCWKQILLCYVVFAIASIPISIAGLLALVIGIFVASAYLQLVHAHLLAQLADLYEAQGGEPVAGSAMASPASAAPPPLPPG